MSKQKLLATFVHISDLHIGILDPATGDAVISPALQTGLDNFALADGLLGHHGQALADLAQFVDDLRSRDEQFHVLATGDLSRTGDSQELALARRFLEREIDLQPPIGNFAGLYAADKLIVIPGNHDHWAGTAGPIGATPSAYYHRFLVALPQTSSIPLGTHGHTLSLIQVDSDADVRPNSIVRIFARGSFSSQLRTLDAALTARADKEVRVLLIHHPRTWTNFKLGMTGKAKRDLDRFLLKQEISVILCGHTHIPSMRRHYTGPREYWECGAGSTTQLDTIPFKWRLKLRNPDKIKTQANALALHRIYDVDGRLEWSATRYTRSASGFNAVLPTRQFALI